jgi:hypothetical protein
VADKNDLKRRKELKRLLIQAAERASDLSTERYDISFGNEHGIVSIGHFAHCERDAREWWLSVAEVGYYQGTLLSVVRIPIHGPKP